MGEFWNLEGISFTEFMVVNGSIVKNNSNLKLVRKHIKKERKKHLFNYFINSEI